MEQMFEEENATPADVRDADVIRGTRYFARTRKTEDGTNRLVLSSETLERLANLLAKALPRSSSRQAGGIDAASSGAGINGSRETPMTSTTKSGGRSQTGADLGDWENDDVARLFRMLQRSMLDTENIAIFPDDHYDRQKVGLNTSSSTVVTPSPTKGGKPTKKKLKQSPTKAAAFKVDLDDERANRLQQDLQRLGEGVTAAGICLRILSVGELPKQVRTTSHDSHVRDLY